MNPVTILLVEDDPAHAALIERNLKRSGFTNDVIKFVNGKQVTDYIFSEGEYAGEKHPKHMLVLLDINMPVMNGAEVLRRLKGNEKTKDIPVIMLTTTDDQTEIDNCYRMGCNAYVVKPVGHAGFTKVIKDLGLFVNILMSPTNGG